MNKIASLPTAADSFNDNHLLIETLNKKYNVITKLGKGGFGEILLVLEIGSQKKYAVKK
jgi:serine/threonine protein kinase|tara:strand:+ start:363 stop:539 length:177 start_codon:yes stop_codon:yes gene_type:complete